MKVIKISVVFLFISVTCLNIFTSCNKSNSDIGTTKSSQVIVTDSHNTTEAVNNQTTYETNDINNPPAATAPQYDNIKSYASELLSSKSVKDSIRRIPTLFNDAQNSSVRITVSESNSFYYYCTTPFISTKSNFEYIFVNCTISFLTDEAKGCFNEKDMASSFAFEKINDNLYMKSGYSENLGCFCVSFAYKVDSECYLINECRIKNIEKMNSKVQEKLLNDFELIKLS